MLIECFGKSGHGQFNVQLRQEVCYPGVSSHRMAVNHNTINKIGWILKHSSLEKNNLGRIQKIEKSLFFRMFALPLCGKGLY